MTDAGDLTALPLTHGGRRIVERALDLQRKHGQAELGVHHWLLAALEWYGPMAEAMAPALDLGMLRGQLRRKLNDGDGGASLDIPTLVAAARARPGATDEVTERNLVAAVLAHAGYAPNDETGTSTGTSLTQTGAGVGPGATATPVLDEFGRDLTREAREGKLSPVIGREDEIREVCRTLCRRTKRNPALIGPAGTGKTAIVEGFAQRVASGDVPEQLRGIRIIALQPSSLVAGAGVVGELEKRMKAVLAEASQEGIVLFIDELHSIVGTGGATGTGDIGALLKPALGRGQISCIGATTDDEYRRFIERDTALERRFRTIAVHEMSAADSFVVLQAHRNKLTELRHVEVPDEVLHWLIDFSEDFLRNRNFPDKAVDLLEQCVATAVMNGESKVDLDEAEAVAQEMVGMPIDLNTRISTLGERLAQAALLNPDDADDLLDRVSITMRGLDLRPTRPNAVVLLTGPTADGGDELAETLAETLLGDTNRVIDMDFGQFDKAEDVNTLLGAPPAYIGFGEHLPLHALVQMPWSVLLLKNVDGCHPEVRDVLAQALLDGYLNERSGKRIHMSDTVVILTAPSERTDRALLGYHSRNKANQPTLETVREELGTRLLDQVDVVVEATPVVTGPRQGWVQRTLLPGLEEQYRENGLTLTWDPTFLAWVQEQQTQQPSRSLLTHLVERCLGEVLIPVLPQPGTRTVARVQAASGALQAVVDESPPPEVTHGGSPAAT